MSIPPVNQETITKGIYLDFEKPIKEETPQIAGVLIDDEYTCYVIDPRLKEAAENRRIDRATEGERWRYCDAEELSLSLLDTAEKEGRHIIGYSEAELKTMTRLVGQEERISELYYNANMGKWFRKRRKTTYNRMLREIKKNPKWGRSRVGLKDILALDFVDYNYPKDLKNYSPASAIREVLKFLGERHHYASVPESHRKKFTKLHRYNMHDCKGMKHLLEYRLSRQKKN